MEIPNTVKLDPDPTLAKSEGAILFYQSAGTEIAALVLDVANVP